MHLDAAAFSQILNRALGAGEYADAFYERRLARTFRLQDGKIHEAGVSLVRGVGIRTIAGERTGYAYTDDLSMETLLSTVDSVELSGEAREAPEMYAAGTLDSGAESATYVDLLARADVAARAFDPRIGTVNAFVSDETQEVVIATSEGLFVRDRRPLVALGVQCVANGSVRGNGFQGDGGRASIDFFATRTPEEIARESARIASVNCEAREAPAGEFEVVVGAGSGGVLLHEAVGHGLEGDFNRHGTSLYSGRVGERVASELVSIYDDGNLHGERGSLAVDDEGTPGQHKVLVERGVLRGYMQDRLNAGLMGVTSTGSGRRQSFRVLPQPRMCNTYMPPGESTYDEIIGSVKKGIFAASFAGGQVEISKGDFVFMLAEGYLIENGKLTTPIRGASLTGNGPEIMNRVTMVGNDARLALPAEKALAAALAEASPAAAERVAAGMPTVKLSRVTVGGSAVA